MHRSKSAGVVGEWRREIEGNIHRIDDRIVRVSNAEQGCAITSGEWHAVLPIGRVWVDV